MERGLLFSQVSVSLVLLLLLGVEAVVGTSRGCPGSTVWREPPSGAPGPGGSSSGDDGVMERHYGHPGALVTGAGGGGDVTVEDDENWAATEGDESYADGEETVRQSR